MIENLKSVAKALIIVCSKNNCLLAECVFTWKKLELYLNEVSNYNKNNLSLYKARYEQVITDAHILLLLF